MRRILIVDDEAAYRRTLTALFSRSGFDVTAVTSGPEAITAAGTSTFDVAITDWMLCDEMHGLDVARELHRDHPALPIILFTGFPHAMLGNDEARRHFIDLVEKPAEFSVILDAVRRALPQSIA